MITASTESMPCATSRGARGNRELLHSPSKIMPNHLTGGLKDRVPFRPNLHAPVGGLFVKISHLGAQLCGIKMGSVQSGHIGEQARIFSIIKDDATHLARRIVNPVGTHGGSGAFYAAEPVMGPGQVPLAAACSPKDAGRPVDITHRGIHYPRMPGTSWGPPNGTSTL